MLMEAKTEQEGVKEKAELLCIAAFF